MKHTTNMGGEQKTYTRTPIKPEDRVKASRNRLAAATTARLKSEKSKRKQIIKENDSLTIQKSGIDPSGEYFGNNRNAKAEQRRRDRAVSLEDSEYYDKSMRSRPDRNPDLSYGRWVKR